MHVHLIQLRCQSLVSFRLPLRQIESSWQPKPKSLESLLSAQTYTGNITQGSAKRVRKAIDLLLQISPERYIYNPITRRHQRFRISFLTLTAPPAIQNLDHKSAKKELLQPFLLWLRRSAGVQSYVWKAELQGNGSLHIHITTNRFIPYDQIKSKWNQILDSAGLLEEFTAKYGHSNPNSTDIHSVQKLKNIRAYLMKYVSKPSSETEQILGKVWDCSKNLKGVGYYDFHPTYEQIKVIRGMVRNKAVKWIGLDQCDIFTGRELLLKSVLTTAQNQEYYAYLQHVSDPKSYANPLRPIPNSPDTEPQNHHSATSTAHSNPRIQTALNLQTSYKP